MGIKTNFNDNENTVPSLLAPFLPKRQPWRGRGPAGAHLVDKPGSVDHVRGEAGHGAVVKALHGFGHLFVNPRQIDLMHALRVDVAVGKH